MYLFKDWKKESLRQGNRLCFNSNKVNKIAINNHKKVIDYLNKKRIKVIKIYFSKRNEEKKYADIRKIILDTSKRYEKKYKKLDLIVY